MKKALIILISITIIAVGLVVAGLVIGEMQISQFDELQTEMVTRGSLSTVVEANGMVQSNQRALLFWKVTGEVEGVNVEAGDRVTEGDILASVNEKTLPAYIIAAQAELVNTQRALDNLLQSQIQQAQALKAVDEARKALEDSHHPETLQAEALMAIAEAQQVVEDAQFAYDIVTAPTPQSAIDQAYANLLLAENKVDDTEYILERLAKGDIRAATYRDEYPKWIIKEIRHEIRKLIKQFELLLVQDKLAYEQSLARYNALLESPDPIDVAAAEAELATAKAQLEEAQREWEKIKDGVSPAEIAVLEAELEDAQREWERVKDGPSQDDITVLETRITAAKAAINQVKIVVPFDGTVTLVETQVHDVVEPGTFAFRIDDLSHLYVTLAVSDIDVNQIDIGQKATLTFDAIPLKEYQGEVTEIALVGTEILGAPSFKVIIELLDADEAIKPGMTSSVKIVLEENENALLVPSQAIRGLNGDRVIYRLRVGTSESLVPLLRWAPNSDSGERFVFPIMFQKPIQFQIEAVTITLGTTSSEYSEILAGDIQVGDYVVLNPPGE